MPMQSRHSALSDSYFHAPRRTVLLVALVVICFFAIYSQLWRDAPYASGDTPEYIDLAQRLVNGQYQEPHDRLLGYPLLLVLTGATEKPTRTLYFVQLAAHLVSVAVLLSILWPISRKQWVLIGFATVMLLPPFVSPAAIALTENLAGLFLSTMVYFFWRHATDGTRNRWAWAGGVACAMAFLVRPVFLLLGPVIGLLVLFLFPARSRGKNLMAGVGFALPCLLAGASYIGVHYSKFGYPGLTPKTGFMLFTRTLTFLEEIPDEHSEIREILIKERDRGLTERGSSHTGMLFIWDGGRERLLQATGIKHAELSSMMLRLNIRLIASAPMEYLSTVFRTLGGFWLVPFSSEAYFGSRFLQGAFACLWLLLLLAYLAAFSSFIALSCARVAGRFGIQQMGWGIMLRGDAAEALASYRLTAFCHLVLWYNAVLSSAMEVGDPRYNLPCVPLMVLVVFLFGSQWVRDADFRNGNFSWRRHSPA